MSKTSMTIKEFTLKAIAYNKTTTGYDGMHVVWSGFNKALRSYFNLKKDAVREAIDGLVKDGVVAMIPWKGGIKLYLPDDAPKKNNSDKPDARSEDMLAAVTSK